MADENPRIANKHPAIDALRTSAMGAPSSILTVDQRLNEPNAIKTKNRRCDPAVSIKSNLLKNQARVPSFLASPSFFLWSPSHLPQ